MYKVKTRSKIFLIGMMGSGKTFWSKKLSIKLKTAAYDLDNLVEIMEERSISEIFKQSGEDFFRKEESKMLKLFGQKKSYILSCGGGTPCYYDNLEWMNKTGITIWLDEPIEVLANRLATEKHLRPLIKTLKDDELAPFLEEKLADRLPFYCNAAYRLSGVQITESNLINIVQDHA